MKPSRASQEIEMRMGLPNSATQAPENSREEAPMEDEEGVVQQEKPLLTWDEVVRLLDSIPGINPRAAQNILAEIGTDMCRFPSARHLASWAGMVRCITRLNIPGAARKNSKPTGCATRCVFVLRSLHRPVQCSGFSLAKGPKIPLHYENGRTTKNALKPDCC